MKTTVLTVFLIALTPGATIGFDEPGLLGQAQTATSEFALALKSELVSAMQAGGPIEAIEVCNTRAPAIAENASLDNGMSLSRVSLRSRSPDNVPSAWQRDVLISFENRKIAGEAPDSLAWHEVVETQTGREFRYMKAIPTAALCLQCHGAAIAPAVASKLAALYPGDKATGFKEGDLRGAFVVTRQLD